MIVSSLSGGKDSAAELTWLVEHYGPDAVIAHYQVLPEDWEETLSYNQQICAALGVRLVAQQALYVPRPGTDHGVRRLEIRDVLRPGDVVPWGTSGVITGVSDLAMRRGWPPSAAIRFCTSAFKRDVLNAWIAANRKQLGDTIVVALGERAAESPRRARKPELWPRLARKTWTAWNWLPVHAWSRRAVFRRLRDWGIEPHPASQYQGMSDRDMYDRGEEGGPRCRCRFCIYASDADVCHQAEMAANRQLLHRLAEIERATEHTWWPRRAAVSLLLQVDA